MPALDFQSFSLAVNLAIFAAAGMVVWTAGTRLATLADAIGERTRLSQAFLGMVVLGVSTSLPEIATTVTAAALGNAVLVAGNLFGGVAMQIAVLAFVDAIAVKGALSHFTPQPLLLLQGVMLLLLLALALAGAASGDPIAFAGIGLTSVLLAVGYLAVLRLSHGEKYLPRWRATDATPDSGRDSDRVGSGLAVVGTPRLYAYSAIAAAAILVAGWGLARIGDVLSEQTGLGASFVGVALVAVSTSLPEVSTALGAVRHGNHEMAVSNILGTNCLELALFLLADAVYREGPILAAVDQSAMFAGSLGMIVTCVFLLGLLERRKTTVLGMGLGSFGVFVAYLCGLAGLYALR